MFISFDFDCYHCCIITHWENWEDNHICIAKYKKKKQIQSANLTIHCSFTYNCRAINHGAVDNGNNLDRDSIGTVADR